MVRASFYLLFASVLTGLIPSAAFANTYFFCVIESYEGDGLYISDIKVTDLDDIDEMRTGLAYSEETNAQFTRDFPGVASRRSYCSSSSNSDWMRKQHQITIDRAPRIKRIDFRNPPVPVRPLTPAENELTVAMPASRSPSKTSTTSEMVNRTDSSTSEETRDADAERARIAAEERARAEAERKSQAEVDALYAQQIKSAQDYLAGEREKIELIERQQREAEVRAAAFERVLANQRRIDAEYRASTARHRKCVAGDRKACEAIEQGKPVDLADDPGAPSTDEDATRCVAAPVVSADDKTFRGQTKAVAINGCDKPVDIRICLLREGGWNCGVNWGVRPQDRMTHTTFLALGGVFWDARYTGTTKALGSPE